MANNTPILASDRDPKSYPSISVVIPCYNAEKYIEETLSSLFTQPFVRLDVIVVDDGSTDGSAEIAQKNFPSVRLVRTPNRGASEARNRGTELAKGEFIQYLDADDLLGEEKMHRQVEVLEQSGADVAYGDWVRIAAGQDGLYVPIGYESGRLRENSALHLFTGFWCPPAVYLFRRRTVLAVGGWNTGLPVIQDARFVLDCALAGARFVWCEGLMAKYRQHPDGLLSRSGFAIYKDMLKNALEIETFWNERGHFDDVWRKGVLDILNQVAVKSYNSDQQLYKISVEAIRRINPNYYPTTSWKIAFMSRLLGYQNALALSASYHRLKQLMALTKQ